MCCPHPAPCRLSSSTVIRRSPKNVEIVRRTLSPIGAYRVLGYLHDKSQQLPEQSIDLSNEQFLLYVPAGNPPVDGYGLLVLIAPWDDGGPGPRRWRRLPLALYAYENVAARFKLNPARVYVSGFSGGSRTAMRAVLSYPDVFRGAFLNSGSDPFGNAGIAVSPAELFALFQQRSRILLVSGDDDPPIDQRDAGMLDSSDRLCVAGVGTQPMRRTGHSLMHDFMLDRALVAIEHTDDERSAKRADALAHCRAGIQAGIAQGLALVRTLIAQREMFKAGRALSQIDERFGGLAAPDSVELAREILQGTIGTNVPD
jgi:pimeloyl-ACP methyl ester carboxylesterase